MSKSMYAQGRRIETISDFDQCESLWYKWNGRTTHRSVLISLQYRTLLNSIIAGRVYVAERRTDEYLKDFSKKEMEYAMEDVIHEALFPNGEEER